jgi:hypothetical protein
LAVIQWLRAVRESFAPEEREEFDAILNQARLTIPAVAPVAAKKQVTPAHIPRINLAPYKKKLRVMPVTYAEY